MTEYEDSPECADALERAECDHVEMKRTDTPTLIARLRALGDGCQYPQLIEDAADALEELTTWRPIETAETGGTRECETVLTHHISDLYPVPAFFVGGEWLREGEGPEDEDIRGRWLPLYRRPTHWMPLPDAPTAKQVSDE